MHVAVFDHGAVAEADQPPRAFGQIHVVRDEHDRGSGRLVELFQQFHDAGAGYAVEIASRLVRKKNLRRVREGTGDGDALLLASRELGREVIHPVAEPHALEQRGGPFCRATVAPQFQRDLHILGRRQRGDQLKGLEDESDLLAPEACALILGQAIKLHSIERHGAARWYVESGQQAKQRRLAAAGRSDDGHERSLRYRKGHLFEDGERADATRVFLLEIGCDEHEDRWQKAYGSRQRAGGPGSNAPTGSCRRRVGRARRRHDGVWWC